METHAPPRCPLRSRPGLELFVLAYPKNRPLYCIPLLAHREKRHYCDQQTRSMPIPVEPASDEAMLLAAVNSFLGQADTKALHTAFTKQEEDIRMLRDAVTGLRETVPRIAEEHKAMREVVTTLHATVTTLQGRIAR